MNLRGHEKAAAWIAAAAATGAFAIGIIAWRASDESSSRVEQLLDEAKAPPPTKVSVQSVPDDFTLVAVNTTQVVADCPPGSSLVSNRADAARCFAPTDGPITGIYDPCFVNTAFSAPPQFLLCPRDPWNPEAGTVTVRPPSQSDAVEPLEPLATDPADFRPWALKLANGVRCFRESGATGSSGGVRFNYGCYGMPFATDTLGSPPLGTPAGFLLGDPVRSRDTWTVLYQQGDFARPFQAVEVREAYL